MKTTIWIKQEQERYSKLASDLSTAIDSNPDLGNKIHPMFENMPDGWTYRMLLISYVSKKKLLEEILKPNF